jgi:glycosyltransferase involved in cell wall biosynthesis
LNQRTKILHICSDTNIGGAGQYVLTLLSQPRITEAFDVAVACPEGDLAAALRRAGIKVMLYPGANVSFTWQALRSLTGLMRSWRPRIAHTHGSLAGRMAAALAGARIIYTKHGLAYAEEQSLQVRAPAPVLKRAAVNLFADRIVAVSEAVRRALEASGAAPERIRVIPGGVALAPFAAVQPPANGMTGVLGALGRLGREKGFDVLLAAMSKLPPGEARLLLGGEGTQGEALARQLHDLGLEDRVTMTGFVADVPAFLSQIGLFVLPSRSEGLGLVAVEAMAAGRPVIATNVGGIPEVVVDGETGVLVPPEQPDALAAAIHRLLRDPVVAAQMGQAGRRRARELFSAERMAEKTAALYEELSSP